MTLRGTRFDWPLSLFLLSALWGAAIAFDSASAARELALLCGGLALYYVLALMPSQLAWRNVYIPLLRVVVGVTPALIVAYFILTHDWAQPVGKAAWLEPFRQWLSTRQPRLGWPRMHPNLVGGVLAMWLPVQVAALLSRPAVEGSYSPGGFLRLFKVFLFGTSCFGLLLSGLRGAWLALAVAAGLALWWQLSDRLSLGRGAWVRLAVWVGGVAAVVVLLVGSSTAAHWLTLRPDRVLVWRNSWDLAWDYAFTGVGLGAFTMAYSSYVLLVHVPHTAHAHNLVLDIWLGQGFVGPLAFTWLMLSALVPIALSPSRDTACRPGPPMRWRAAAAISLLVILVHGLLDDVYYGYDGIGVMALFVPFALLARRSGRALPKAVWPSRGARLALAGFASALLVLMAASHPARAQLEANLGALSQTSAELSVYRWPQWPIQDALRRSDDVNLDAAVRHYRAALATDPGNATANRRMGQIELSRGQYDDALRHLDAAHRHAPGQQSTRQLLGESLAVKGNVTGAADLWRTLPLEEDQLAIRRSWYESIGDALRAQRVGTAIALARK